MTLHRDGKQAVSPLAHSKVACAISQATIYDEGDTQNIPGLDPLTEGSRACSMVMIFFGVDELR